MKRFVLSHLAVATAVTALTPGVLAQELMSGNADTRPAMSETEEEAVFASAVNTERRYRNRLARLRRLRDIARTHRNQRRIHELEQLMDDNHRRHEQRINRLSRMVNGDARRDLVEAVSDGRSEGVDWVRPQPSVADATVRRHVRVALKEKQQGTRAVKRDRRQDRRAARGAARASLITRRIASDAPNARLQHLRPELRQHLTRLSNQKKADRQARKISTATAEAEYQLLRQEISSDR